MSTRCNVIVKDKNSTDYIYHHCDGYLSGVGRELKEFIKTVYKPVNYSADEICMQLNKWDHSYEIDNDSEIHGDIEYLYTIRVNDDNKINISVEALDWKDDTWHEVEDYTEII